MAINYTIKKNTVPNETDNKYLGKVSVNNAFYKEELIDRMLQMGTTLTKSDILACFELFKSATEKIILEGNALNIDDFISIRPSMSAKFKTETETFDAAKDDVYAVSVISPVFNKKIKKNAVVKRIQKREIKPEIYKVKDYETETTNKTITSQDYASIEGKNLKFIPDNTKEGIFIKIYDKKNNSLKEEIRANKYLKVENREILFVLPYFTSSPECLYSIELRSSMKSKTLHISNEIREMRGG